MTNTIAPAGFIIFNDEAIWGAGPTEDAAWTGMESEMRLAGITLLYDESDYPEDSAYTRVSRFQIRPASAALIAEVDRKGGNISWHIAGRVCCTTAEYEG